MRAGERRDEAQRGDCSSETGLTAHSDGVKTIGHKKLDAASRPIKDDCPRKRYGGPFKKAAMSA
jgi:hypothetical protein